MKDILDTQICDMDSIRAFIADDIVLFATKLLSTPRTGPVTLGEVLNCAEFFVEQYPVSAAKLLAGLAIIDMRKGS